MKKFGLDYPSAVREIAGRVGVQVPETRSAGPDPNEPLYSALGVAADWFAKRLREGEDAAHARAYLEQRGLGPEVWDEFGLGYAPLPRDVLLEAMRALGLDEAMLVAAGLAVQRDDGGTAPRFRGRLLFPIADVRGRVVGFGGRILGDGEPKYLNSPESAVFHKGTLLYLLDRARNAIRAEGQAIVVEGYVDAIRLHVHGITAAVAPLGTALTPEQAKVLRRYTKRVVLCYDADLPGLRSTFRAGDELLRQGITVQVVTLPPGEDPDTLVGRGGAAAWRDAAGQAVDLFDRKLQLLERKQLFDTLEGRRRALDRLLPTIRAAADPITRGLYIARAAERTGVPPAVLEQEAARADRRAGTAAPAEDRDEERPRSRAPDRLAALPPDIPQERTLTALLLQDPRWVARLEGERLDAASFRHPLYREIVAAVVAGRTEPPDEELAPLWEALARPPEGDYDAEAAFSAAAAWVRDRPRRERLAAIDGLMALADAAQKEQLFEEKRALLAEGAQRFRRKALRTEQEPT
jgi:DNA primase